jgi:hypothetical protein
MMAMPTVGERLMSGDEREKRTAVLELISDSRRYQACPAGMARTRLNGKMRGKGEALTKLPVQDGSAVVAGANPALRLGSKMMARTLG